MPSLADSFSPCGKVAVGRLIRYPLTHSAAQGPVFHPNRQPEQSKLFHRFTQMPQTPLLLASASTIRLALLQQAGVQASAQPARIDEEAVRQSLEAEGATPRDVADTLAELKARKLADRNPQALVLGCDQVLALKDQVFAKPESLDQARAQLTALRGQTHQLLSAMVLYHNAEPIWRHVGTARLTMRDFTDAYLDDYLSRQWPAIGQSVGAYQLESEGIRLFSAVEGDYFTILGLPLLPLLAYLSLRGFIAS
jgi:septum formation protein